MGHLDAGVDDGDDLALALLGELVGVHHDLGAEVVRVLGRQSGRLCAALGIDLVDVADAGFALEECGLDAAHPTDRVEGTGWRAKRESFEGLVVLALHLGRCARECRGHGLVDRGEGRLSVGTLLELNDADAAALGIADGDRVRVTSRRGSLKTTAHVSDKTNPGQTWMPFHFQDGNSNWLTIAALDPVSKAPEYKVCAVRVEKA